MQKGMKCSIDENHELLQVIVDWPEVECRELNYVVWSFFHDIEAATEQRFFNHKILKTRNLEW